MITIYDILITAGGTFALYLLAHMIMQMTEQEPPEDLIHPDDEDKESLDLLVNNTKTKDII